MAQLCAQALPAITRTPRHSPCSCGQAGPEQPRGWVPVPSSVPRLNLHVSHGTLSASPRCWHTPVPGCPGENEASTHPTWFLTELGNADKPWGTWGDTEQGAGGGQGCAPGILLLSPKSLPMERKGFVGIPSPRSRPSPAPTLSACPSTAAAVSHLTFSSPLSRAGSCSPSHGSATARRGKDTRDTPSLARLPTCA